MNNTITDAQQAFILLTLVQPAEEIVERLNAGFYREKDIPWLNSKLESMASIASRMMKKGKHMAASPIAEDAPMNDHNVQRYITYFSTLARFFRYHIEN